MSDYTKSLLYHKITELAEFIPASSLERLFQTITKRTIEKGETLLKQGQICHTIFFVESGYLRVFIEKDATEINTDFIFENNFVTNLKSLRQSIPSETTIQAGESALVYEFNKDKLMILYKDSPEIESFGRKLLEQLLIASEEHSNLFKIFSPTERYKYLQANKPQLLQRISLSHIASYLGIARETLSRIRKSK